MKNLILLTDNLGFFGFKYIAEPYRSGMSKDLLARRFAEHGLDIQFTQFSNIDFRIPHITGNTYLYTSSEDPGYHYKSYIEDIVYGLENAGARVIPPYKYLRANNNKVFMEILRDQSGLPELQSIKSFHFGTLEELKATINSCPEYSVIKSAEGAMSRGVLGANNKQELIKCAARLSATPMFKKDVWDLVRRLYFRGYKMISTHRRKFVVQNMIPGLSNDWKILCFANKYYVLRRANRDNDFRASGSGKFEFRRELPQGILDYARRVYLHFNVPNLSLDIAYDGNFHVIEFQAIFFGSTTLCKSPFHFQYNDGIWIIVDGTSELETEYANSVAWYLNKHD